MRQTISWSGGQAARTKSSSLPRRHFLTASFITTALSVVAERPASGKSVPNCERRTSRDSSDEMTAHRRDYYRRARF